MKKNKSEKQNENSVFKLDNFIIVVLAIVVTATFSIGTIYNKKVLATNKSEYEESMKEVQVEEERVKNLTVYEKIAEGKDLNILILGDGISESTYRGDNINLWYSKLKKWIKEEYNSDINIFNSSFRNNTVYDSYNTFNNADMSKYDLAIISFGYDEDFNISKSNYKGIYETLIRQIKKSNNKNDIIPIIQHGVKESKDYKNAITELGRHYNLNVANLYDEFLEESDFIAYDGVSPSEEGDDVYFETIKNIISENVSNQKACDEIEDVLYKEETKIFETNNILTEYKNVDGFEIIGDNFISKKDGATIEFQVNSRVVGLRYFTSMEEGSIQVYLNDSLLIEIDTKGNNERVKSVIIANNMEESNTIKIVCTGENSYIRLIGLLCNGNLTEETKEVSENVDTTESDTDNEEENITKPSDSANNNQNSSKPNNNIINKPTKPSGGSNNTGSGNTNAGSGSNTGSNNDGTGNGNTGDNSGNDSENGSGSDNNNGSGADNNNGAGSDNNNGGSGDNGTGSEGGDSSGSGNNTGGNSDGTGNNNETNNGSNNKPGEDVESPKE